MIFIKIVFLSQSLEFVKRIKNPPTSLNIDSLGVAHHPKEYFHALSGLESGASIVLSLSV